MPRSTTLWQVVTVVFVVIGVLAVAVIALVATGRVVNRLEPEPERRVFTHDEALSFVVEALPDEATASLSYDDVSRIMRLHLDFLHSRGVARSGGDLLGGDGPMVIQPGEARAFVLERGARVGFHPEGAFVDDVIDAQLAYFEAIGAVSEVASPDIDGPTPPMPPR